MSEGLRVGKARAASKGYLKGDRPGSRQKRKIYEQNEHGVWVVARTNVRKDNWSIGDREAYKRNRNMVAAYRARKNRKAK